MGCGARLKLLDLLVRSSIPEEERLFDLGHGPKRCEDALTLLPLALNSKRHGTWSEKMSNACRVATH